MGMVVVRNSSTFRSPLKYCSTSLGTLSRLFQPSGEVGRGSDLCAGEGGGGVTCVQGRGWGSDLCAGEGVGGPWQGGGGPVCRGGGGGVTCVQGRGWGSDLCAGEGVGVTCVQGRGWGVTCVQGRGWGSDLCAGEGVGE